jgi:hypothetical protein
MCGLCPPAEISVLAVLAADLEDGEDEDDVKVDELDSDLTLIAPAAGDAIMQSAFINPIERRRPGCLRCNAFAGVDIVECEFGSTPFLLVCLPFGVLYNSEFWSLSMTTSLVPLPYPCTNISWYDSLLDLVVGVVKPAGDCEQDDGEGDSGMCANLLSERLILPLKLSLRDGGLAEPVSLPLHLDIDEPRPPRDFGGWISLFCVRAE